MITSVSLVSGFMVGVEFFDDEDTGEHYFIVDAGILRIIFGW